MNSEWQKRYLPPSATLWQGRADSLPGERFFQRVQCLDFRQPLPLSQNDKTFVLLGFNSDEGVRRNLGRVGAAQGPQALRQALGRLPLHLDDEWEIFDIGDIVCQDGELEAAQFALKEMIAILVNNHYLPIVLGGGHETAYGHYLGIADAHPDHHIGIINFDAHFDLRQTEQISTSGTPFLQISEFCHQHKKSFDYYVIGIQPFANTDSLFETAERLAVNYIFAEDIQQNSAENFLPDLMDFIAAQDMIYLTFCMDVFAQAFAPGVSAPQPLGLLPLHVLPFLRKIIQSGKVASFDIVELAPPLDKDQMTASLAAQLVAEYMHLAADQEL